MARACECCWIRARGGRSSRMGRDKALIPCGDHTLIGHIARVVERACGSVVLVGCPERYRALAISRN